jgi:3-oxoadipate enol-lactonase
MEATINGITINYADEGSGLPILLLHAFPLSHALWQPQVAALRERYRLITPDLRGFGASDVPKGPYTMELLADDAAALLDHLKLEQVVVGGLSMGGYISLAFWRRHADRVRGLVLGDTRAGPDNEEGRMKREANAQLAEQQGTAAIAEQMLPALVAPGTSAELRAHLQAIITGNHPRGIAAALRGMALRADSHPTLATISVPTLIIVGEQDGLTPPAEAEQMHAAIAGSRLTTIAGAGHLASIEQPAAFTAALAAFLETLE